MWRLFQVCGFPKALKRLHDSIWGIFGGSEPPGYTLGFVTAVLAEALSRRIRKQHIIVDWYGDFACLSRTIGKSGDLYNTKGSSEAPIGSLRLPGEGGGGVLTMTAPPFMRKIQVLQLDVSLLLRSGFFWTESDVRALFAAHAAYSML